MRCHCRGIQSKGQKEEKSVRVKEQRKEKSLPREDYI
jgi:hypothetical protein